MHQGILIKTGGLKKVKIGFANNMSIIYSGMPSDKSFAITFMYNGFASNIFYPKNSAFITVIYQTFKVLEVTPDYIILAHEKKSDIRQKKS